MYNKLTVIIPTYNRQAYALRNMEFWNTTDVQIHILDGSSEAIPQEEIEHFNENINYHHLPVSWHDRLEAVTTFIKTEYVTFLSDDEFLSVQGVGRSIEELEKDKDLIACCGHALNFHFDQELNEVFGYEILPNIGDRSFLQNTPEERVLSNMEHFSPSLFYSIIRKEEWLKTLAIILEKQINAYAIAEVQLEISICMMGKTKVIPELFLLRSSENRSFNIPNTWFDRNNYIYEWWSQNQQEREELLDRMSYHLGSFSNSQFEARQLIKKGFELFNIQHEIATKAEDKHNTLMKNRYLKDDTRRSIRRMYLRYAPEWLVKLKHKIDNRKNLLAFLKSQNKYAFNEAEVSRIRDMILAFHQDNYL